MKIYPRKILNNVKKVLEAPEIIVIHGARQTGKTTLLNILIDKLKKQNNPSNVVYFDLGSAPQSVDTFCVKFSDNFKQKLPAG